MSQQKLNLICMVQFATSLMSALNGINKQSFQGFKLRVGVNSGSVIAGIIGAQRPFYDIWGDCVNVSAARFQCVSSLSAGAVILTPIVVSSPSTDRQSDGQSGRNWPHPGGGEDSPAADGRFVHRE